MINKQILFLAILVFVLSACNNELSVDPANQSGLRILSAPESGITFNNKLKNSADLNIIKYLYYYNGGGVAVGDVNQDGLEDIYFTGNEGPDKLYINKGDLKFEDATKRAGIIEDESWSSGVVIEDINGDGLNDIYVTKVGVLTNRNYHNLLYINNGDGTFNEQAREMGLDFRGFGTQACFIDYDKDGDLDVYLLNHAIHSVRSYGNTEKRVERDTFAGDRFYENKLSEENKFVEVTQQANIYSSPLGYGLAISAADVNNDGWTDIYVGNDFHENDYLYINNGDKTFTESINKYFPYTSQFSMGVDIADVNGDGWNDIFSTDMMPYDPKVVLKSGGEDTDQIKRIKDELGFERQNARNHFHLSDGNGQFSEVAFQKNLFATDWSWTILMQDFNNDKNIDVFITNGIVGRPNDLDYINYMNSQTKEAKDESLINQMPKQPLNNLLFKGNKNGGYSALDKSKVGKPTFSNGAAYSDLDQDGDLDLIVNNIDERSFVMENLSEQNGNYLSVLLKTDLKNKTLKGSKVYLRNNGELMMKEYQTVKGFQSSSSHVLHFGLGDMTQVDELNVIWPDGKSSVLKNVNTNQILEVNYDTAKETNAEQMFEKNTNYEYLVFPFQHQDNKYYDEESESLVPERLSYEGPALLCEDLTGDGIKDLYLGGARNQKARLLIGKKNGSFTEKEIPNFESDAKYEDVDAATIDFDADGDLDLYVVSGGNDNKELDKILEDRLYLNNGNGDFRRVPLSLPHTNGSTISVADFDKDGFTDIFIGASSIPGSYGLSPYSFLLKNLEGKGVDIAFKKRFGMVKDSDWSDIDADGDLDLTICGDWMPIRILMNNNGELEDETKAFGLSELKGFWNTVAYVDLNKDGKLDLLAGNDGNNKKWSASIESPIDLSLGDFDQNGSSDPVITYKYFDRYIPFSALDKLKSQMPAVKKKFATYEDFSKVTKAEEIFDGLKDNLVETKSITELRSMVFIQSENGFEGVPLDDIAQRSCINDFEVTASGDIYYVGNSSSYVAELGASLSNAGGVLSNFDVEKKNFASHQSLGLPSRFEGRKVKSLTADKLVAIGNNNYTFFIYPK